MKLYNVEVRGVSMGGYDGTSAADAIAACAEHTGLDMTGATAVPSEYDCGCNPWRDHYDLTPGGM
jgi:hypothetical protein